MVLLQPGREEDYIPFLEVRKTPITPLTTPDINITDEDARAATQAMRQTVLSDRAFNDKAKRGFVSWVRSYSKHQASSIFRVGDLDWEDLGNAWGLLRLPKMPELKSWQGDRSLGLDIDWDAYAYIKDKKREDTRKRALAEEKKKKKQKEVVSDPVDDDDDDGNKAPPPPLPPPEKEKEKKKKKQLKRAWSQKLDARDEREMRRNKKRAKRDRDKWEKMTPAEREKQRDLERLIDEVKAKKAEEDRFVGTFEGFDD